VNVDDCWHGTRDPGGNIQASSNFTGGSLKPLGDYIHSKGLKFGLYTCVGSATCAGKPGSLNFEEKDIQQYVAWGVNYVKIDWCSKTAAQTANPLGAYKVFGDAIRKHDSSMVFSICNWGEFNPWVWGKQAGGQLWRSTPDIRLGWESFTGIIDRQLNLWQYAGPGGWNDPDMLEVGRGMTLEEDKSHFGMWCLLSAPLIAGNDLRNMSTATKTILTNAELIAVNQDPLGHQAQRVAKNGDLEVWAKPLAGNARAVGLFNRSASTQSVTVNWADLNKWEAKGLPWTAGQSVTVRDLWTHVDVATGQSGSYSAQVPSHGLAVFRLYDPAASIQRNFRGFRGIEIRPRRIAVKSPGPHALSILDLRGRTLWSRRGGGEAEYELGARPGLRVLQIEISGTRKAEKF
jgi:alpha-galactosidase